MFVTIAIYVLTVSYSDTFVNDSSEIGYDEDFVFNKFCLSDKTWGWSYVRGLKSS